MEPIRFIPSQCKGADAPFSGVILINPPTFDERYEYIEDCGLEMGDNMEIKVSIGMMKSLRKLVKCAEKHVVSCEIVKTESGDKYNSIQELKLDPSCDSILMELGSLMIKGIRPEKN